MAALLGGLVGLERESLNRPAGFRTHTLVSVGSALFMIISISVAQTYAKVSDADPGRIAAQVVSGIGFLGAGTILRNGLTITGLTTAASLWMVAAIGLACGLGSYPAAVGGTAISLTILLFFSKIEDYVIDRRQVSLIKITAAQDNPEIINKIDALLRTNQIKIQGIKMSDLDTNYRLIEILARLTPRTSITSVTAQIIALGSVISVSHEGRTYGD